VIADGKRPKRARKLRVKPVREHCFAFAELLQKPLRIARLSTRERGGSF
jgi:hypothetical protein